MRPLWQGSVLLAVCLAVAAVAVPAFAQSGSNSSSLNVVVTTDQAGYDPGERVTITVQVARDGQPVSARIHRAILTRYSQWGMGRQQSIARHFHQIQPGVLVAQAPAGDPGLRQLYVEVSTYVSGPCGGCNRVIGAGTASYAVNPLPSKLAFCDPEFVVKHVVDVPDWTVDPPVTWDLPDHVLTQIRSRANNVTFELAPAGTAVWSSAPPFGWVNDDLSNLQRSQLTFDPQTGTVSGDLDFRDADRNDPNWHYFIRAQNGNGQVIATVWMQIAFR